MNPDFQPPFVLPITGNNQVVKPTTLNKFSYGINRLTNGIRYPQAKAPDSGIAFLANPIATARVVATAQEDPFDVGQTIDGVDIADGDVIFLQNQDDPTENGLYIAVDSDDWDNITSDPLTTLVWVNDGSVYYDTLWGIFDPDNNDWEVVNAIIRRFQVSSLGLTTANTLGCHPYKADGTLDSTVDVTIAKPFLVQDIAAWNGLTFTYSDTQTRVATRTSDSKTENQVLVPAYVAADQIYAVRSVLHTGITDVDWVDLNLDARQWAKKAG